MWPARFVAEALRRPSSRYGKNFVRVAGSGAAGQLLLLLASPLLTRLYAPADFGLYGVVVALVGIGLSCATARVEWLVPNAGSTRQATALFAIGVVVLLGSLAVLAILASTAPYWLGEPGGTEQWSGLARAIWAVPCLLAVGASMQLLQAWQVRTANLKGLSRSMLVNHGGHVSASLGVGGISAGAAGVWGLVAGGVVGGIGATWLLCRHSADLLATLRRLGCRHLIAAWRRHRHALGWSTLASTLNALSIAIIPLMLLRHFTATEVGFYALAQRIAFAPVGVVTAAVRQSFWAEAARLVRHDPRALTTLFGASTRRLAWFSLPVVGLALAGPWYVGPLFGSQQWGEAGLVLAAGVPMLVGQIMVSPLSHLEVHGLQRWQARWDAARLLLLLACIEVAGRAEASMPQAVLALSLVGALMYGVLALLNRLALRRATQRRGQVA